MNIFPFINSRDVALHLKNIGYEFSSAEAAWLVRQSKKHTMAEKHEAWLEIIDTMSDERIRAGGDCAESRSLHACLNEYMKRQNEAVRMFFTDIPQTYYNATAYGIENGIPFTAWDPSAHLRTDDAVAHYKNDYPHGESSFRGFSIDKFRIGHPKAEITLCVDAAHRVLDVQADKVSDFFPAMRVAFPTPFEKGDFLVQTKAGHDWLYPGGTTAFVLDSLCTDANELRAYGYRPYVGYGAIQPYTDLEYADEATRRENREMIPISLFLKGRINAMETAEAYRVLANRRKAESDQQSVLFREEIRRIWET